VVSIQQARAYWTGLCGGHHNEPANLQKLQNEVIPVIPIAGDVDTTFFQQDGTFPYTENVILYITVMSC
jgi:hypothetical protein